MLKKIAIALFFLSINAQAQKMFDSGKDFDIFHSYTKWGVQVEGLGYFPAQITPTNDNAFKSQMGIGYKLGLVYNVNLSNHFGIRLGALAGKVPAINTYFVLNHSDLNTTNDYFHKKWAKYSPFNFSFPVLLEYRNFSLNRFILSFDAGIQVERTSSAVITETYDKYYTTVVANPGSWDVDLLARAGWYFQFKRLMTQTSIVYKHRLNDQYVGTYAFTNLKNDHNASGIYVQKGDYIGLSFDFYFHRRAREVDMGCRANTQSQQVKKRQKRQEKERAKIRKRQERMKRKSKRKKHWWQFWR